MEFDFDVNRILQDKISKIDHSLNVNETKLTDKDMRRRLLDIINQIGQESGKAQELPVAVTTAEKFLASDHIIYLMKDSEGNARGTGTIVGVLKMGRKKLFLLDQSGIQNELMPLCVLDFYIHESQQRKGYGKQLFEYMLLKENTEAQLLAIDRPSSKFLGFLKKHYNLWDTIPQVNNFTIFKEFFSAHAIHSSATKLPCYIRAGARNLDSFSTHRYSDPTGYAGFNLGSHSKATSKKEISQITERNFNAKSRNLKRISYPNNSHSFRPETEPQGFSNALAAHNNNYSRHFQNPASGTCHLKNTSPNGNIPPSSSPEQDDGPQETVQKNPNEQQARKPLPSSSPQNLLDGKPKQNDSSLNIFGFPASWTQSSCSRSRQSIHS